MKMAEALILRASLQREVEELRQRAADNIQVQEGDEPLEDPEEILELTIVKTDELTEVIKSINNTNNNTSFNDEMKLSEALAERDGIQKKIEIISTMINYGRISPDRFSRTEVKFVTVMSIKELQKEKNLLSKQWREIDTKIQQLNWNTDLI